VSRVAVEGDDGRQGDEVGRKGINEEREQVADDNAGCETQSPKPTLAMPEGPGTDYTGQASHLPRGVSAETDPPLWFVRQNECPRSGEHPAHPVHKRDLGIGNLARPALATELARRLDNGENAVHSGVRVG
jgi:hypothetical protein